jgi:endoglucanase
MKIKLVILLIASIGFYQPFASGQTIVEKYGKLSVKGNYMMGEHGDTVQLRGMSFFWSQWMGKYYNEDVVKWLKDNWSCTVVRAAMGVMQGGYHDNPDEKEKVINLVDAAIKHGIYVIIDFHSHDAHKNAKEAVVFFQEMAEKYGKYPNVLYEIYNEPIGSPWSKVLKPYADTLTKAIRAKDPDNIIICGTRQWSQMVSEAALDPVKETNIMYSLHFYAGTHGQSLRDEATKAMENGAALFVTEYGTCDASGNGNYDTTATRAWYQYMDKHKLSHCNWSVADKVETASILKPGASAQGGWSDDELTASGKFVRAEIRSKNKAILSKLNAKKDKKK